MKNYYQIAAAVVGFGILSLGMGHLHAAFESWPGKWKIVFIGMMPIGGLAVAIAVKYIQVQRARSWIGIPGKIISSKSVRRKVERSLSASNDQDHEIRNFAEITYAYKVGTQTLQGSKLSIAADLGNSEVAEKLARYKTGSKVTVYYNPAQPSEAVIERDLSEGSFKYGLLLVSGLTAVLFAAVFGAELLTNVLRRELPTPRNAPLVVFMLVFALVLARFAFVLRRQAASVSGWGHTTGAIVASEAETFDAAQARLGGPRSKLIRQRVTYRYAVAGVDYMSDRVSFGARTSSSLRALEQSIVRRYPVGASVPVFYDPANPSEAVLERGARLLWLMWGSAALFAGAAVYFAGV